MGIYFLLFVFLILFLLVRFLFKFDRNNSIESVSNNNIDSAPNI